ncbi:hypothetical protein [Hasllibacter sp. MH4015]|uniref:hypothetical protein n=1 Tax=Hasllibacter sp. MH4015 TaxID=2854029 RepID=UPI001CD309BA|nr:hypothetical protein [Hasllibacter sp. MH4015]
MAQDQPKPLLVRLLLFVVGGYCALAILFTGLLVPFLMVANWAGGPSRASGWGEWMLGLGIWVAGFGTALIVRMDGPMRWVTLAIVAVLLIAGMLVFIGTETGNPATYLLWVIAFVGHGAVMALAFRALSR